MTTLAGGWFNRHCLRVLFRGAMVLVLCADAMSSFAGEPAMRIDHASLVRVTFENNLRITAARYDVDAAEYQFLHFERNLSQFRPLVVESAVEREAESVLDDGSRIEQVDDEGRVSVGMEKEYFDGTRLGASTGMRQTWDGDGRNHNPFVALEARFPLFSSFTKLERITERSFEESQMLEAWLDFIDTIRDAIGNTQEAYFDLQQMLSLRGIITRAHTDFETLLNDPVVSGRARDVNLLEDQLQAYQSRLVEEEGDIAAAQIRLLDHLGLEDVSPSSIEEMDLYATPFYGAHYLQSPIPDLTARALDNDVEIRVLEIAKENALLKQRLADKGRWDIVGRVVGAYDFESKGDDPGRARGYRAGVAFSVERNDPHLLRLSRRRADAEEQKFTARIEYRRRQIGNEIRRHVGQARNLREVVDELERSRDLRRAVFEEKREAYLAGEEPLDNVVQARGQYYSTERDLLESLSDFFEIILDLDQASGEYFVQLGDAVASLDRPGLRAKQLD